MDIIGASSVESFQPTLQVGSDNFQDLVRARIANAMVNYQTTLPQTQNMNVIGANSNAFPEVIMQQQPPPPRLLQSETQQRLQNIMLATRQPLPGAAAAAAGIQSTGGRTAATAATVLSSSESNMVIVLLLAIVLLIIGYCVYQMLKARRVKEKQHSVHGATIAAATTNPGKHPIDDDGSWPMQQQQQKRRFR